MRHWQGLATETRGAEIAEAAAVLPLVFMLLLGIFWFGRAYNIYATITHAAREGARMAVARSCAVCGNNLRSADQVAEKISQVLQAPKLDPTQVSPLVPSLCACGNSGCGSSTVACEALSAGEPQVCVQFDVQLDNPTSASPTCGVAVSFQYPYQFYFPFTSLNLQLINLKAQTQMGGED